MRKRYERNATGLLLKEAIEEFLITYKLKDKLYHARAIQAWESTVGEMIAKHTEKLNIRNKILYVKVDSSVVRNELLYARKKIILALNKAAGMVVIEDIVLR